jgi:pantetheine-phosphate adenylyltransferase
LSRTKRRALYPGSFDPVTFGHLDVIDRARQQFDEVHVAVAINTDKSPLFSTEDRVQLLKKAVGKRKGIYVNAFHGLIVDHAKSLKAGTIIRGLRATSDFDYEFQMALTNRTIAKEIDTVFLMPSEKYFYVSSRLIKEISRWGGDISRFVPAHVKQLLAELHR